jgi:phage FluMu gp28-like protein
MMIAKFDARVKKYGGKACHDATGLGDVVGDYQNANAEGVILSGQTRSDVFTKYIAALEDGAIESAAIKYCEGEHRYCTNEDLSGSGHPPDSFVAGAMAYRASQQKVERGRPAVAGKRQTSKFTMR